MLLNNSKRISFKGAVLQDVVELAGLFDPKFEKKKRRKEHVADGAAKSVREFTYRTFFLP